MLFLITIVTLVSSSGKSNGEDYQQEIFYCKPYIDNDKLKAFYKNGEYWVDWGDALLTNNTNIENCHVSKMDIAWDKEGT